MKKGITRNSVLAILCSLVFSNCYSQWTPNTAVNTPICIATGAQRDPRIESDGFGGAFIAWKDYRAGLPDIYVQRVDSNGMPLWTIDGIGACTQAADQSTPSITTDMHGGIIVTWSDWRSGIERDIYAQRIDGNGNLLWAADGALVAGKPEREHNERVVSDGEGGCIIAFEQQNSSTFQWDIWAQRLDSLGNNVWVWGGIPITSINSNKRNPKLQKDQSGGTYITWQDLRNGVDYDIYAQHFDNVGNWLWGTGGIAICTATGDQNNPKIDPDTIEGGVYIGWADQRNGLNIDIYCHRIDSMGNLLWPVNGIPVCLATGNQTAVDLLSNSNVDGVILTWKDERNGNTDIYAQSINPTGSILWALDGISVISNSFPQLNPNIAGDGMGGAVICWQDSTAASEWDVKTQRINAAGVKMWNANGVNVSSAAGSQVGPKNTSDGKGGSIYIWEDFRTGTRDIYAQHIYYDGYQVGVENNSNHMIQIWPNPCSDILWLNIKEDANIKLYDVNGKLIMAKNLNTNQNSISLSHLSNGIYFLNIQTEGGETNQKIIKY